MSILSRSAWRWRVAGVAALGAAALTAAAAAWAANEDIEFVAEHLPEVAMDNRYSTLPVWAGLDRRPGAASAGLLASYSSVGSGQLRLSGPGLAVALQRPMASGWSLTAFAFYDDLEFSGSGDRRPLATVAIPAVPLPLPADAIFDRLRGHLRHPGLGMSVARRGDGGRLGAHRWVAGLIVEQVRLEDYRADYRILTGSATGTRGTVDYSHDYGQVTPFAGIEFPRAHGRWTFAPHALLAVPLPRRGIFARMAGPGFDLHGDSAAAGNGKHFGDASLALGVDATYEPWGLTVDLGSTLTQATLERYVHEGIDHNVSLSLGWRF